MKDPSVA